MPSPLTALLLLSLHCCSLATNPFTGKGLWAQLLEVHRTGKAPHPECQTRTLSLTAQGVMKTEDTKGFCTRFLRNPSWADNLSTSLSTKAAWDLQTSCPSWRAWFIWYALSNLNVCQVFIHRHGLLHNTRIEYLLRKWWTWIPGFSLLRRAETTASASWGKMQSLQRRTNLDLSRRDLGLSFCSLGCSNIQCQMASGLKNKYKPEIIKDSETGTRNTSLLAKFHNH